MNKHLKHISKQLMVFALIASIFNVYALELWCSVTMAASHHQDKATEHYHGGNSDANHLHEGLVPNHEHNDHGSSVSGETHKHEDKCPHQGATKGKDDCCKDQTNLFYASLSGSGLQKFKFTPDDFQFLVPDNLTFKGSHANSLAARPVKLFPDEGLRPKIPDIRIFICSLTI
jgi:hypothetical protein